MLSLVIFTLAGLLLGSVSNGLVQRLSTQMIEDANAFAREQLGLPENAGTPKSLSTAASSPAWMRQAPLALGSVIGVACGSYPGSVWQAVALFAAAFLMLWLSAVDLKTMHLPEPLNYGLGGIGILAGALGWFVSPEKALLGVLVGYLSLYIPAIVFYRVRGIAGLGEGDCLLLAAMGAYIGPMAVVPLLLLASIVAIVGHILVGGTRKEPMPFGPALALAGVFTFVLTRVPALQPAILQTFFQ